MIFLLELLTQLKLLSVEFAYANLELDDARLKTVVVLILLLDRVLQMLYLSVAFFKLFRHLACHVLVMTHFLVLVAQLLLDLLQSHLHRLELALVLSLHLALGSLQLGPT